MKESNNCCSVTTIPSEEYFNLKRVYEEVKGKIDDVKVISFERQFGCGYDNFYIVDPESVDKRLADEVERLHEEVRTISEQYNEQKKLTESWKKDATNSTQLIKDKSARLIEIQSKWWYKLFS